MKWFLFLLIYDPAHMIHVYCRLLKPGRRTTLGIGDNREQCFYIPVSFQLIREYINRGFLLEELVFIVIEYLIVKQTTKL